MDDQKGQLVILGDFFELLRYPLESIVARRRDLLDRLARMEAMYVPGNHDEDTMRQIDPSDPPHAFFERMSDAFTLPIGDKRFKFMHGHEVDPFTNAGIQSVSRVIGAVAYLFNSRQGACILSNDAFTDAMLELGEHLLGAWNLNSGSWTGATNNFLRIAPDGQAAVFDWGRSGPRINRTVVAN